MKWQGRSKRKSTGARLVKPNSKKKRDLGQEYVAAHLNPPRKKFVRGLGGTRKIRILQEQNANVTDTKTGKTEQVEIEDVIGNTANNYYIRRDILTKGAIIKTSIGSARITSRPGQEGVVNAIKIDAE